MKRKLIGYDAFEKIQSESLTNVQAELEAAAGPLNRTMPSAPRPCGVAIATIVSSVANISLAPTRARRVGAPLTSSLR